MGGCNNIWSVTRWVDVILLTSECKSFTLRLKTNEAKMYHTLISYNKDLSRSTDQDVVLDVPDHPGEL